MKDNSKKPRLRLVWKILAIIIVVFVVVSLVLMFRYWWLQRNKKETVGVSFSQVQAERFGSDWKANYSALLSDAGFKHIRVASYWDRIEKSPGQYDFSELDYMAAQAASQHAKLTIVVGQKTLRVPECYYPSWLNKNDSTAVSDAADKFVAAVVNRYKDSNVIEAWQVENEFLLKNFGDCPSANLTNKQLNNEVTIVKKIDPNTPIVITQSNQTGFPINKPYGDIFGFSMYRWVWGPFGYYRYPQSGMYNLWKAAIINLYTKSDIKIHELQAEAWGKTGNENLSFEQANQTMNPKQLAENIDYARQTQIKDFDLWGAEWWWYLKSQGHPEMWEAAKTYATQ